MSFAFTVPTTCSRPSFKMLAIILLLLFLFLRKRYSSHTVNIFASNFARSVYCASVYDFWSDTVCNFYATLTISHLKTKCRSSISRLLTCLMQIPTALISLESWPWRSRCIASIRVLLLQHVHCERHADTESWAHFRSLSCPTLPLWNTVALPLPRDVGALTGSRWWGWVPTRHLSAEGKPRGEVPPPVAGGTRRRIQRHPLRYTYRLSAPHPHASRNLSEWTVYLHF